MKFSKKLANFKEKLIDLATGRAIRRRYVIYYVVGFIVGLALAWFWLENRVNNADYYLKLANKGLVELNKNHAKEAGAVEEIKNNVRQAVFVSGAKDPAVAEMAARISEGLIRFDQNSLITASEYYDLQTQLEPNNPWPYWRKAVLRLDTVSGPNEDGRRQIYLQALMQVEQAIALNPEFAEAYYTKAVILEGKNEFDLAIEAAKTSLLIKNNPRTSLTLARLLLNRGFSRRGQQSDLSKNSKIHENTDLTTVRNLLLPLANNGSEQLNALYLLIDLESRLGNKKLAQSYSEKLLKLLPNGEQKQQQAERIKALAR